MVTLANVTHRDPGYPQRQSGLCWYSGSSSLAFRLSEGGESIDEFLHQFPSVKREFAIAVLDAAYELLRQMRILLDENFSGRLRDVMGAADTSTFHSHGWAGIKNGSYFVVRTAYAKYCNARPQS